MTNNTGDTLKACPFCGMQPKSITVCETTAMVGVTCPEESPCNGSGLLIALGERDGSIDKAIRQWNTRHPEPTGDRMAALEALDKFVKYFKLHAGINEGFHWEQSSFGELERNIRTALTAPVPEVMSEEKFLELVRHAAPEYLARYLSKEHPSGIIVKEKS